MGDKKQILIVQWWVKKEGLDGLCGCEIVRNLIMFKGLGVCRVQMKIINNKLDYRASYVYGHQVVV